MKRKGLIFVMLLGLFCGFSADSMATHQVPGRKIRKVVIDAGHGGHDPGAVGKKYKESHIVLSLSKKLGTLIKSTYPDIEIIYTRTTDEFIELHKRARIANTAKADLFISLHCNASENPVPSGTETWVMGLHKSAANLETARLENATILMEDDYENQYDGFDPNSPEAYILFSLFQNMYLEQSLDLASKIQYQFDKNLGRVNRGVKQAGFLVLYKTTMPGILIEAGFISNPQEEEYLGSESGQTALVGSIFKAFQEYKRSVEGVMADEGPSAPGNPVVVQHDTVAKAPQRVHPHREAPRDSSAKKEADEICFRVQFMASSVRKNSASPEFKGLEDVRSYQQNGIFKYTSGHFSTMEEAVKRQHEMQQRGFRDAFVVAFRNEVRITPAEALQLLNSKKN